MKIKRGKAGIRAASSIMAAGEDEHGFSGRFDDTPVDDSVDEYADDEFEDGTVDESEPIEDIEEDDVDIEIDNNIANHFIAECDKCHGIFISALAESDQSVERISGICPLCDNETDQYLKWVIKPIEKNITE